MNSHPIIAPSLLSANFLSLGDDIKTLESLGIQLLHLDIMDGHFVPNLTFGIPIVKAICKATSIPTDAHLMVTNPDDYIKPFADAGVRYFSFHIEAVTHSHRMLQKIKDHGMKAGVALNPGTPITAITELLPFADFVLVMSVNPGFSGQTFIPTALPKIATLVELRRQLGLTFLIEIDGGVSDQNIKQIISAGTDLIVAGSYIFEAADIAVAVRSLQNV